MAFRIPSQILSIPRLPKFYRPFLVHPSVFLAWVTFSRPVWFTSPPLAPPTPTPVFKSSRKAGLQMNCLPIKKKTLLFDVQLSADVCVDQFTGGKKKCSCWFIDYKQDHSPFIEGMAASWCSTARWTSKETEKNGHSKQTRCLIPPGMFIENKNKNLALEFLMSVLANNAA